MTVAEVVALLHRTRFRFVAEKDLQEGIAEMLIRSRIAFEREVRLTQKDRIDFMLGDGIGLEVKIDKSLAEVTRQLFRYAQHERILSLILVTSRVRLTNVPSTILGKPLVAVDLLRSIL